MSQYFSKYIKKQYYPVHNSQIKFKTYFANCIKSAMLNHGYTQTQEDDWNIYWCEKEFLNETLDKMRLFPNKRVNHFRNWYEICRKDLLAKNIKRYKKALEKEGKIAEANGYNFSPLTYNLPTEYPIFLEEFKRANKAIWIMKPIGKSQGKGIFLFNKINDISDWSQISNQAESYIVQRYIHNPLVIGHKKFDLRFYVLVTSHNPLTIYLYRSGFARFTHFRYDCLDIDNLEAHLTNVAIQKNCENYDEERGGKYLLDKLRQYLLSKYPQEKVTECFFNIQELVIKTMLSTSKIISNDKRCFQLYGFDVMIDSDFKPWLIEINGSPSMTANTPIDENLKIGLLDDTLTIVDLQQILSGEEEQVGGFDVILRNGNRVRPNLGIHADKNPHVFMKKEYSMLGCENNREQNMRRLAKLTALRLAEEVKNKREASKNANNSVANKNSIMNSQRGRSINMGAQNKVANPKAAHLTSNSTFSNPNPRAKQMGIKLPKVINSSTSTNIHTSSSGSNKNIEIKKPADSMFRVSGSREERR